MENIIGRTKTCIKEFQETGMLFNSDFKLFDIHICNKTNKEVTLFISDSEISKTITHIDPNSNLSLNFQTGLTGWRGARLEIYIPEEEQTPEESYYETEEDEYEEEEYEEETENQENGGNVYITANYLEIVGQHYSVWRT